MGPVRRSHALRAAFALAALLTACTPQDTTTGAPATPTDAGPSTTTAQPPATSPPPSEPSPSEPSSTEPPPPAGITADTFVLAPPEGGSFLVRARYPRIRTGCKNPARPNLVARFPGTLTAERAEDGTITLSATMPFEKYLEGIAEVPSSWPMAALQAQAIAARTYALATTGWTGEGTGLDEPICSSSSCQVYRGISVPPQPELERWYRAVRSTAGKVLVYRGRPAHTVYFSTSNGRTLANEEVFGSSPLPYLRSVPERDDGDSPTSRWEVSLPYQDLATFLSKAGMWPSGKRIEAVTREGASMRVAGSGQARTLPVSEFRAAVNQWAVCLLPGKYPGDSRFGTPLPVAVPSVWFSAAAGESAVTLTGRGWGHGVGMVQWGAYGKAKRGMSATEILAAYYGGLEPVPFPEPRLIQIQVARGIATFSALPSGEGAHLNGKKVGSGPVVITSGETLWATT